MESHLSPRVLCADDNQDLCELLVMLLGKSGIEVRLASNAYDALRLAHDESFDLYMLDSQFSDKDGFELCRQLREMDQSTPILFFSGAAYDRDKQKAAAAGANAYVVKPDPSGILVGTVLQLINP
jgi:two-component system alkaline phosphatase synthesis response regulator PhoP